MNIENEVPDDISMTRAYFIDLMKRNPRIKKIYFSKQHTADIMRIRDANKADSYPDKLYDLPVVWNAEKTKIINVI